VPEDSWLIAAYYGTAIMVCPVCGIAFVPHGTHDDLPDRHCLECCRWEAEHGAASTAPTLRRHFTSPDDQG